MTSAATSKTSSLKVRFRYGSGPTDEDFITGSEDDGSYVAIPMTVTGIHNSGGMEVSPITIDVPMGHSTFFDALAKGVPFPTITLYVTETLTAYGPSGVATETLNHAIGDYRLSNVYRNADREAGLIRLEFMHHKSRTKVRLGMASNPTCGWTFGDKNCQVDAVALEETGTIASIVRKKVTLTNPTDLAVVDSKPAGDFPYWYRGFMEIDGLRIGIRDWTDGSYEFHLTHEPPAEWLAAVVTLRPGCGKTPTDCEDKFSNIINFGGFGIKIPAYNPVLEVS